MVNPPCLMRFDEPPPPPAAAVVTPPAEELVAMIPPPAEEVRSGREEEPDRVRYMVPLVVDLPAFEPNEVEAAPCQ